MKRSPLRRKTELKRVVWRPEGVVLQRKTKLRARYKPIPPAVREEVAERSGGICEARTPVCSGLQEHLHHKLPRSAGGKHAAENLLAVCLTCHAYAHSRPAESYANGWLIRRGVRTGGAE